MSEDPTRTATLSLPFTVYAVALLYTTPTGQQLCAEVVSVSGKNPLSNDEAIARARSRADAPGLVYVAGTSSLVVSF